ncbi:hypothetical protein SeMB42_g05920 [Synchytrium endobioticum]|uniref:Uncharacterized protein n=1 Tax=Synchytrium endobioticum TaxID=286115 RepID=A0A507CNB2_9FUNG|nr:hypothetical protein SeMB42_g05920 [Synchytrium endobioticum]
MCVTSEDSSIRLNGRGQCRSFNYAPRFRLLFATMIILLPYPQERCLRVFLLSFRESHPNDPPTRNYYDTSRCCYQADA